MVSDGPGSVPQDGTSERPQGGECPLAVSSRRRALDRLRAAVEPGGHVPILITGEPGAGKTWLSEQLARSCHPQWRSCRVDLTRAMNALDFLQLIGHSLGMPAGEGLGAARHGCNRSFTTTNGRRPALAADRRRSPSRLPRCLGRDPGQWSINRVGPGGFAALVVLGDTDWSCCSARGDFGGFALLPGVHLHLPPLDLDEARSYWHFTGQAHDRGRVGLEDLHRDARGNPAGCFASPRRGRVIWRPRPIRVNHSARRQDLFRPSPRGTTAQLT